jgi:hypothetical protein
LRTIDPVDQGGRIGTIVFIGRRFVGAASLAPRETDHASIAVRRRQPSIIKVVSGIDVDGEQ